MKIGIIVAMEKEFKQLMSLLEKQHAEQHNGNCLKCGGNVHGSSLSEQVVRSVAF